MRSDGPYDNDHPLIREARSMGLTPSQAQIYARAKQRGEISRETILQFAEIRRGDAVHTKWCDVQLSHMRKRLRPYGMTMKCVGRYWGLWRLEKLEPAE